MSRSIRRAVLTALCSGLLVLSGAPAALAHDALKRSSPAKDASVERLTEVELEFTSRVRFPAVVLHDASGRRHESGKPRTEGKKVMQDVAGPLPAGAYVIAWRVVSSDGHPIEGEIPFTVTRPATPTPTLTPSTPTPETPTPGTTTPAASVSAGNDQGVPAWIWAGLAALVAIGAVLAFRGSRRPRDEPGTESGADRPE